MMGKIYYYIHRTDTGRAPCVDYGILTLAICKPEIRRKATKGDWVTGLTSKDFGWKLSYAAHVASRTPGREYYGLGKNDGRSDCIYRIAPSGHYILRSHDVHAEDNMQSDVGSFEDNYQNAWVLLATEFWYFGANALEVANADYPEFHAMLEKLKQGHRVHHTPAVRNELEAFLASLQKRYRPGIYGPPRDANQLELEDVTNHGECD